jgi:DNA-directed RNA polymerase specialized sigma subunit
MRKKSEAQIFLEQVERLDARITNKLIEKQQWKDIALGITANMDGERVQSSGAKDKMANAVTKCVDMEAEIDSLVDELIDTKKKVIQTIEKLYSPTEYKLLHLRYIQYVPLKDIADMWGTEYTNITTTHGRALKNVQDIINKRNVCDSA